MEQVESGVYNSTRALGLTSWMGVKHRIDPDHACHFRAREPLLKDDRFPFDVCVVGGCGHVGLPLAITIASQDLKVGVYDIDDRSVALVRSGKMPFLESGAEPKLREVIGRSLEVANDPTLVTRSRLVIVVIGTPVDEHLNPTYHVMRQTISELLPLLVDGQCLILRSTVYPGTTEKVRELVATTGRNIHVAFCPERVAEGKAIDELSSLPQIIAGCDDQAVYMAEDLFARVARSIIYLSPLEAELTKIFANVWRYIQFATANQFFMIAADYGLDFYRIHDALTREYPRMAGLPKSGFAAGPCLFKDTMQLGAAMNNNFALGHAAMLINEGLPNFLVRHAKCVIPSRICALACSAWHLKPTVTTLASRCHTNSARSLHMRQRRCYVPISISLTLTFKRSKRL